MNFDWSHALFKSFDGIIADPSGGGIRKKSKAKRLLILDSIFTTLTACSTHKEKKDFLQY